MGFIGISIPGQRKKRKAIILECSTAVLAWRVSYKIMNYKACKSDTDVDFAEKITPTSVVYYGFCGISISEQIRFIEGILKNPILILCALSVTTCIP